MRQILPVVLYNARLRCSFAAKRRNKIHSIHSHQIPDSPYPLPPPPKVDSKEVALNTYGHDCKGELGFAGGGELSGHVISPGSAGEDPPHRACVSMCMCKIRSREHFFFGNQTSWFLAGCGRPGACARDGCCRLRHPCRSQSARPLRCFLNPTSERLGRAGEAPALFSSVHTWSPFHPFIHRLTSHSFQTSSSRVLICVHHPLLPLIPQPPLFLPNVNDLGKLPDMN